MSVQSSPKTLGEKASVLIFIAVQEVFILSLKVYFLTLVIYCTCMYLDTYYLWRYRRR